MNETGGGVCETQARPLWDLWFVVKAVKDTARNQAGKNPARRLFLKNVRCYNRIMETEDQKFVEKKITEHVAKFHKRTRRSVFIEPTFEEVKAFFQEKQIDISPESFINFYASKGWMVGKNKMKDWRRAALNARNWENAPCNPHLTKEKTPEQILKEKQALERKRQEIRDNNGGYFEEKTTTELTEMLTNTGYIIYHWLIKEVLEERE